jgi:hypothetical protein
MNRLDGSRPLTFARMVPCQGRNCAVLPVLSFCHRPCSVSEVAALGRQVSEGMTSERSSGT